MTDTNASAEPSRPIVLGSRSPRRRELLGSLLGGLFPDAFDPIAIDIRPPRSADEDPLDDLADEADLTRRLGDIVAGKMRLVLDDLPPGDMRPVLAADTAVVLDDPLRSLGQPPEGDAYAATVRDWLRQMGGTVHRVITAVELSFVPPEADAAAGGRQSWTTQQTTRVRLKTLSPDLIDWYLATGEPRGKAGGYAVQGLGSVLIDRIEGSLTNVIGLPLEPLRTVLPAVLGGPNA